jgi:hypothetical protein
VRDYRAVPIEVLRDFARSQTEITSIRTVAEEIGLGRSTLHKFILGRTNPQPRVRRLLALWYLDKIGRAHHMDVARPYVSALDILLSAVPEEKRGAAERGLLNALAEIHTDTGAPTPRWLEVLRSPGV